MMKRKVGIVLFKISKMKGELYSDRGRKNGTGEGKNTGG